MSKTEWIIEPTEEDRLRKEVSLAHYSMSLLKKRIAELTAQRDRLRDCIRDEWGGYDDREIEHEAHDLHLGDMTGA